MNHRMALHGRSARAKRLVLLVAAAATLAGPFAARPALGAGSPELTAMIPEFNRICADLVRARDGLLGGALDERSFADRVLALFVAADSLRAALDAGPANQRLRTFALDRGLRFLIESLRENYVGIVAKDGLRFVSADQALQAALAWRSSVVDVAEAARP